METKEKRPQNVSEKKISLKAAQGFWMQLKKFISKSQAVVKLK